MSIVPAGMIVFFPSYKFLNTAKGMWLRTGTLDKFALKKPVCYKILRPGVTAYISFETKVFFEPEESTQVEKVLQDYATAATSVCE
jgi:chromosome transmission fidelity protein 1